MIRPATVADARAIGALQLRAWMRAYEDIVDGSVIAAYDVDGREARWLKILTAGDSTTFVAVVGGRVCGFIWIGADRTGHPVPATGEIWGLYVDPAAQGAGLGGELLSAGEDRLRDDGNAHGVLRVFRDNGHARGFYEGHGWTYVAGSDHQDGWAIEVTYEKSL